MASWRRWIRTGLLATIALSVIAVFLESGAVEGDLSNRVVQQLAAEGHAWASVRVAGRNVTITGTAPSTESQQMAMQTAAGVMGVHAVTNSSDLLPMVSPYMWSARRLGRMVTVSGYVPSESSRNSILAVTRRALPEAQISDEMKLARGAGSGFGAGTAFALAQLAGLAEGLVTLNDATLSVSGVAASAQNFTDLREAFANKVPSAIALGPVDLLPARADPFVWSAAYDGTSVTFSGYVPNEVVHETLIATAKASLARVPVVDQLSVASGEPEGFAEAASFAVTALARLSDGGVMLDGLTLDIAGTARSVDDYEAVLDGISGDLPEGLKIVANDIKPAMVSPYGWQGEKNGNSVVLSGYVPSLDGHNEIATLARAQFAGQLLTDNTRIAAGEPQMDWIGGVKFAMGVLAKLNRGKVTLGDKTFSMEGEAASPAAFAEILSANEHTLPASLELAKAEILPPRISPYRFVAENGPQGVKLDGYAPSEADKQKILDMAQRKFGQVAIEDKLVYASGAPADYVDAVSAALEAMNRLGGARAEIVDTSFNLEGTAYYLAAADDIESAAKESLPEGYIPAFAIALRQGDQLVDPQRCRDLLQRELQRGHIEFNGSKAEIADDSFGLLDRVAATIARCPDATVEVGAHSDSDGSTAKNRDLTQARAEAIVDYLVDAGVQRERLTAVGHGEATPIADNATPAGKAANRRIEFTVLLPGEVPDDGVLPDDGEPPDDG